MPRRMSCSMTKDSVRSKIKRVTRRDPNTWVDTKPGDIITLVEKAMGLPAGAKQVVICDVVIVSNRLETLGDVTAEEVALEGVDMTVLAFKRWWAVSHGFPASMEDSLLDYIPCRRIEWSYQ